MILLAWMEHKMFDCSACTDSMKRANGCRDAPTMRDGTVRAWRFPPERPEVEIHTCPANVLNGSPDIVEVFRALNLSGASVGVDAQQDLPYPYLEALSLAAHHQSARQAYDMRQNAARRKAARRV